MRTVIVLNQDQMGHGEHASRRLGAVLRLLKGPAEKLSPLLKGLDAAELMALPAPDASYEVAYEPEVPPIAEAEAPQTVAALRRELSGLRLMGLHKRAVAEGVPSAATDDAMEADDPKAELIALLVEVHVSLALRK